MKAKELLRLYKAGERNFRGENLHGESFRGQNLSGADFSEADMREADFSEADIRGTNFRGAKLVEAKFIKTIAGLQRCWTISLILIAALIAGLSSLSSVLVGSLVLQLFSGQPETLIRGWISLIILVLFWEFTLRRGIKAGLNIAIIAAAIAFVFAFLSGVIAIVSGESPVATKGLFTLVNSVIFSFTGSVIVLLVFGFGFAFSFAIIFSVTSTATSTVSLAITAVLICMLAVIYIVVGMTWIGGGLEILFALLIVVAVTFTLTLLNIYVAWQAITGNPKYVLIRTPALALAAIGGTSFQEADLTEADLSQALLKNTDFRKATLKQTCWQGTKRLHHLLPGDTYLKDAQVRRLISTGEGKGQNFDFQNLRGVNLRGAQLADSSFIATDLSEANLQDADLSRAILVQTQLDQTNLRRACLTGACLENWGITGETQLEGVHCDYVFMHLLEPGEKNGNPLRKPDNWNEFFSEGDFADFIKPIVDTLDLYHNQNLDPRVVALSFKNLAENHPEAKLEIVAMEKRGHDKFLLRAKTTKAANHSELSRDYFEIYDRVRVELRQEMQPLLAEKDDHIHDLKNYLETVSEIAKNLISKQPSVSITAGGDIGNFSGVTGGNISGVVNLGEIQGTVTTAISNLPNSTKADHLNLKTLLKQLQTAILNEPDLTEPDKVMALEKVQVLAEAGQDLQSGKLQKTARQAIGMLKGITSGLTEGGKLVEACNRLLPEIANLLDLL